MESLLGRSQKLKEKIKNFWSQNFFWIEGKIKERNPIFKGSLKDPFSYLGLFSVILFLLMLFSFPFCLQRDFYFLFAETTDKNFQQNLFIGSVTSWPESPDLNLIQKNSLMASIPPVVVTPQVLGAWGGDQDYEIARREIVEYIVEEDDTLEEVAERFGVSQDTIRWANKIEGSVLQPGQKLTILPLSGALHVVRAHDTLSEIVSWYKADMEEVVEFNEIEDAKQIFAGDILIIPGGIKPSSLPSPRGRPAPGTNFTYPVEERPIRITQGLHYYNAIDFGASCGSYVLASESGTVQRTGYSSIGGNYVRILHSNGIVTYYGHLTHGGILVTPGQYVVRGQRIGLVGRTGYATGCHVHFEVRGAANPFAR